MRGADVFIEQLFSIKKLEDFVPADHPLRPIRPMVNAALKRLDGLFEQMYEPTWKGGRPSIAPEKLARAMLLQVLYGIRSERQLLGRSSATCCIAGSSAWRWTMRCGCRRCSARTASG